MIYFKPLKRKTKRNNTRKVKQCFINKIIHLSCNSEMCVCMVVCLKTATGPQWFPELQWYVEEETSSRKEQILPREEETTWMVGKSPQGKNKSPQEKMKPP